MCCIASNEKLRFAFFVKFPKVQEVQIGDKGFVLKFLFLELNCFFDFSVHLRILIVILFCISSATGFCVATWNVSC